MANLKDQVAILKHVDVLIANAFLGEKSRLRREGMRRARFILKMEADILWDKALRSELPGMPR